MNNSAWNPTNEMWCTKVNIKLIYYVKHLIWIQKLIFILRLLNNHYCLQKVNFYFNSTFVCKSSISTLLNTSQFNIILAWFNGIIRQWKCVLVYKFIIYICFLPGSVCIVCIDLNSLFIKKYVLNLI